MTKLDRVSASDARPVRGGRRSRNRQQPASRYFAFLSYSHKDEELATWLHRELERFRVPAALFGRITERGIVPKRLTPVFRDQHELAAATDLGSEIRTALSATQYLVVLCSPDAAASRWTNAEIDTFKRVRPEGCIFAAIGAGEPFASGVPGREAEECFPSALRQKYDRRGRPTKQKAEPLAADLRDEADGRRIGFLKLVAGMLGVGLDELVQRDTIRRQRRMAWVVAASLAGMGITSTLAITAIQARDAARDQRRQAEGLVGFMLGDLKDKLEPIGRLDALDAVGSKALSYYQHQSKGELPDDSLAQRSKALTLIGQIAELRGNQAEALRRYQEALATTGELLRRYPDDPKRLFDHAQNVFYVGQIAWQRGEETQAEARFKEYHALADRMVELDTAKSDYRLEQIYADTNLGTVLMSEQRYREAAAIYESAQVAAERLAAQQPSNPDYHQQLIDNLSWMAEAHGFSGQVQRAIAERQRELSLLAQSERRDPRDTGVQRDLTVAHRALGTLLPLVGDRDGGITQLRIAASIDDRLKSIEPNNEDWQQSSAQTNFDLAVIQLAEGRIAEADRSTSAGCATADRLGAKSASTDWLPKIKVACLELRARIALRKHRLDDALGDAESAVTAAQSTAKPTQRAILTLRAKAVGSDVLVTQGRSAEAAQWAHQALAQIPASAELIPREQALVAHLARRTGDMVRARSIERQLQQTGFHSLDVNLGT